MIQRQLFITTKDNVVLSSLLCEPTIATKKIIILCHGITVDKEEGGVFTKLSQELVSSGFATIRFDFRGHGESGGNSEEMTISGELVDLEAVYQAVKKEGFEKIGIIAQSFGGGIATLFTPSHTIEALCLWSPVLNYEHCFLHPTLPWLSQRKDEIRQDFKEKGWSTLGSRKMKIGKELYGEMENYFPFKQLHKITVPTVIVHGSADTYVPYEDSQKYILEMKEKGKLVTIEGGEHGFHDNPVHEEEAERITVAFFRKNL
ncbi:MAG TPA: alpha/beta fold hydrolase [Patescibacteria group bacterium]|nr:alpha/beta fold hydrolase [Patescibacteria group bacterium]